MRRCSGVASRPATVGSSPGDCLECRLPLRAFRERAGQPQAGPPPPPPLLHGPAPALSPFVGPRSAGLSRSPGPHLDVPAPRGAFLSHRGRRAHSKIRCLADLEPDAQKATGGWCFGHDGAPGRSAPAGFRPVGSSGALQVGQGRFGRSFLNAGRDRAGVSRAGWIGLSQGRRRSTAASPVSWARCERRTRARSSGCRPRGALILGRVQAARVCFISRKACVWASDGIRLTVRGQRLKHVLSQR